jgi:DNA invertase Pin-like site-specific DNA recombinase
MNHPSKKPARTLPLVRCAVSVRKSTEEGLEQEFNSLDAQREAGEAYVASQRSEGWTCLPDRYDDGGFTGGNMERPALRRLLADVEAGKIDCVVVYKVDRLSRSLLDFARMMQTFDQQRVSFVSVTQQFNTATSMGRLILNVLLSFAQFGREIISERTRDKIAATRRKGKWSGGLPIHPRLRRRSAGLSPGPQRRRGGAGTGHLPTLSPARSAAAGGAGVGEAGLGQQALDDAGRPGMRRPAVHQDQPAPLADQRPLRRQGPLQGRGA